MRRRSDKNTSKRRRQPYEQHYDLQKKQGQKATPRANLEGPNGPLIRDPQVVSADWEVRQDGEGNFRSKAAFGVGSGRLNTTAWRLASALPACSSCSAASS